MVVSLRRFFTLVDVTEECGHTAAGVICGVYKQGLLQDLVIQSLTYCCPPLAASRLHRMLLAAHGCRLPLAA